MCGLLKQKKIAVTQTALLESQLFYFWCCSDIFWTLQQLLEVSSQYVKCYDIYFYGRRIIIWWSEEDGKFSECIDTRKNKNNKAISSLMMRYLSTLRLNICWLTHAVLCKMLRTFSTPRYTAHLGYINWKYYFWKITVTYSDTIKLQLQALRWQSTNGVCSVHFLLLRH